MKYVVRGIGLAVSLSIVATLSLAPRASAQTNPAANVYVQIQGSAGAVYGFTASSTGQLTAISGAPWKPSGQIIGANSTQLFTMGQTELHSYGIASNGAVESQLFSTAFLSYAGGSCGADGGYPQAELDPNGNAIFVLLQNGGDGSCAAYQIYNVGSDGSFSITGASVRDTSAGESLDLPSILGSGTFAYADLMDGHSSSQIGFQGPGAPYQYLQFTETNPTLSGGSYMPYRPDASPTSSFLVMQLLPNDSEPAQLGVYTVGEHGSIWTTNTSSSMPTSPFNNISTTFSPSGKIFVAYADNGEGPGGNGIQLYKFNGGSPLTPYETLLNGTPIDQVLWDNSNHMYAISKAENKLYVFTVTTTSVTEDTAWSIGSPFQMIVVSDSQTSSNPPTQFTVPLLTTTGALAVGGEVTVDTSGNITFELNEQGSSKAYTLQFCPAVDSNKGSQGPPCFNVASLTTSAEGNGIATVKFPQSGNWAGEFSTGGSTGAPQLQSGLFPNVNSETYMAKLLPESTTNSGADTNVNGQYPLSSGSVSYTNGNLTFTLDGAAPNTQFQLIQTEGGYLDSSNSYGIGSITTNGSGNGSATIDMATDGSDDGDMFEVEGGNEAGFIGGFTIP